MFKVKIKRNNFGVLRPLKVNQRGVHHYIIPAVAFVLLFAIIGAFLIVRPHAAPTYYLERMNVGGLCLDRSSTSANTLSWKCSDTDANQAWNLIPVGGNYMLQNKNSGQCVNDPGASVGSGPGHWTGLTSHSCDSSTGVVFRNYGGAWLNPASHYGGTNGCINDPGSSTAEGHQLIMYPCNGTGLTTFSSAVWGSTSGGGSGGVSCANPFRSVSSLHGTRIDQGVDYTGSGTVYAVCNGKITNVDGRGGWNFGGADSFITVQFSLNGHTVNAYVAEGCNNVSVYVGESVTTGTKICSLIGGGSGIEAGWSVTPVTTQPLAQLYGGNGSATTTAGGSFNHFIRSLGGPGGFLSGGPIGSALPSYYPSPEY